MPRLRLFAILCFDSDERREAPRLVYRLDTRGAGLYRRQPVTVPPVPCHLRFTRQRHPPRQVTLPPPDPFCHSPSQRVVEVAALDQWLAMLYPRVEHQAVLAVVVVVVGPLVVHPYHPFRDAVRLLRQPAVFIVAVDIVRIFRDAVMDKSSVPVLIPRNEQFTTNAGEIRVDEVLPSDAKKEEPPPCTFTLCRDIWLLPVRLEQIENRSTTRNGVINITFSVAPGTDFRTLDLNKLRFWLGNDDNYTRDQLYLWFCEYLQGADLTVGEQHLRLPEFMLKAVGFEPQDAMLPWPKNVHSGYRILQEYFCYPDAFLFFDLCGCPALPDGLQAEFFTLQLRFSRPLPVDIRLRRDSLRLYCAPAINLFIHHAEAITLDNRRADYPLVPSRHYPQHYDVFSVNSVVSQVQDMFRKKDLGRPVSTQAARQWPAFESFSHQMEYSRKREVVYWHHRTKTSLFHRGFDHTLAFIHADGSYPSDESLLSNEVVSVSLTCTNRELPSQIRSGDITGTTGKNAAVASFRNITRPTQPLWPVIDGSLHWSLLSAMNLNYLSLLDTDALKQVIANFDRHAIHHPQTARLSQQKLDAIERLETRPVDRLFTGIPVRGLASTLYLHPEPFVCEGEMYLLGTVLSHFLSLYASVNSFHMLTVVNTESQETWKWTERIGQHPLI